MAELEIIGLDETGQELEAPQVGDTYVAKRDVSIEANLAITGTVDGRDIAADGAVLDTALQPGDAVTADGTVPLTANWDVGAFSITAAVLVADQWMDFTPIAAPAHSEGRVFYDLTRKTLSYYTDNADVTLNIGEENWIPVTNNTGVQIDDGTPVYISGIDTGIVEITPAIANGYRIIGLATHDIANGATGRVTTSGSLSGPDYTGFSVGDTLYVSAVTAGVLTNVAPIWPDKVIEVGTVLDNSNPGSVQIDMEHHGNSNVVIKSYTFGARTAALGEYFQAGFYDYAAAAVALTQAAPASNYGIANFPYAAHAFMVFGSGGTDGTTITITVSGTSITDAGTRTPADNEVLYTGTAGLTVDDYFETAKKWVGTVVYTLSSDGVTFNCTFNNGLAKYEDFNNLDGKLLGVECVGLCDTTDTDFDIELLYHSDQNWTYSAAAFQAGSTPLASMNVDHGTENDLTGGAAFAWKRTNISQDIVGSGSEGVLVRVTTGTNNSIAFMDTHLSATLS